MKLSEILKEISAIDQAVNLAKDVHADQLRKTGKPYVTHPLRVYKLAKKYGLSQTEQVVALLHDTIEDSKNPKIVQKKIQKLFGGKVLQVVNLLTHKKGVDYNAYLFNLAKKSKTALNVKLLDICDNIYDIPSTAQREKYKNAIRFIRDKKVKLPKQLVSKILGA